MNPTFTVDTETLAPFFALLVERVAHGNQDAIHELRLHFLRGITYLLTRGVGPARSGILAEQIVADLIGAIQKGEVSDPECLPKFVRTLVLRTIASESDKPRHHTRNGGIGSADSAAAEQLLRSLPPRDKECLIRFFYEQQPEKRICRELNLTSAEFRVICNRAKRSLFGR